MIKDFFALAFENLKHRGVRSWLTMLGIFIGIAAVVSLISLGNGLQEAITGQFSSLSTDKLTVMNAETGFGPPGSTAVKKLTQHDVDIVESTPGVVRVIPRLLRVASFEYNKVKEFGYVVSMPMDQDQINYIYSSFNLKVDSGNFVNLADTGKVLLGSDYNKDKFGKPIKAGSTVLIQGKKFIVSGILEKSSTFQVNAAIMMLEDDLKDTLNIGDEFDIIVAQVESKDLMDQTAKEISKRIRQDRKEKIGEEDFTVQTPVQALSAVNTILNIINIIVVGIAAISLIVGGIGIANTMFTSILERRKEIGTMKAVGAKNKDILSIFLIESGLLGLVGGIIGALIGISLAFFASFAVQAGLGIDLLKVQISWPLLFSAILFSFVLGIVSGVVPALQASRLRPVEALRA